MKRANTIAILILSFILALALVPLNQAWADPPAQGTYCSTPPFLVTPNPPNIAVIMDNSLSMACAAYDSGFDPTQFVSGYYYGYYDPTSLYQYASSKWSKYTGTTPALDATTASPIALGNLLNWASMRRVEVSKKLLVGGNQNPRVPTGAGETVKLDGENTSGYCASFDKTYDNTLAPGMIFPFVGNYRYTRSSKYLSISPMNPGADTENVRPNSNLSVPAAWVVTGAGGVAWDAVNDAAADTTTYIENRNTASPSLPAIFGYKPYVPTIAGTITNVTVRIRMKKTGSGTFRAEGVFTMKSAGGDVDYNQPYSNLTTSYANYDFSLATNPQTGLAWQWADLTGNAVGSMSGFGVRSNTTPSASKYLTVTQIYMIVTISNPSGGPYTFTVDTGHAYGDAAERGIMNSLSDDVRFSLAYYATSNEGAKIDQDMNFGITSTMVASINNMNPATYTPLAESLYETVNYIKQVTPYYSSNSPADYQTGLNYDPYYFNYTGTADDRYVPCAKTFILFLTDGESTYDQSIPNTIKGYAPAAVRYAGTPVGQTYGLQGTDYMIDVAYWMRRNDNGDLRPGACTTVPTAFNTCIPGKQGAVLYDVFLFGSGSSLLKDAAITGGFNDTNSDNVPNCITVPAECFRDTNGDGIVSADGSDLPLTYYEGDDGYALERAITEAIAAILRRSASGTAASVLASGEGSGANLIQSIFYPKKAFFNNTEINWIGTLQNLWYYIDPRTAHSTIRENTTDSALTADKELNLTLDRIVNFMYDPTDQMTKAQLFVDANGDGVKDSATPVSTVDMPDLKYLWESGLMLWNQTEASRRIYTPINTALSITNTSNEFKTANIGTLQGLLNTNLAVNSSAPLRDTQLATNVINYVRGIDQAPCAAASCGVDKTYRSRTVAIDLNKDGDASDTVTVNGVTMGEAQKVWKLGDVVSSTPRIESWIPLNAYDKSYADASYTAYTKSSVYTDRGMVYAGANDGMLHALKLGTLAFDNFGYCSTAGTVCTQTSDCPGTEYCNFYELAHLQGTDLGTEQWAFIPKNTLPYLQYLADDAYCHLYYVDATPVLFDASFNTAGCSGNYWDCPKYQKVCSGNRSQACTSDMQCGVDEGACTAKAGFGSERWRTVLIGGMRLGGGCKGSSYTGSNGVKVPGATAGYEGYSSYFALDITNPSSPTLLWEFAPTDGSLGFSTSGPAIARINGGGDANYSAKERNGRWFVIFASGPTGPLDTTYHQFKGFSDQNMKLFVLDLATGALVRTIDTGVTNAFGGSLTNSLIDYDFDYQDDALYVGYTKAESESGSPAVPAGTAKWTSGGVLRLATNSIDPNTWSLSTVMSGIGAVTASVGHLAHYPGTLSTPDQGFLYFGSGRYFYNNASGSDDPQTAQRIYGISEPCVTTTGFNPACTTARSFSDLTEAATAAGTTDEQGWYINLQTYASTDVTKNERVITDPLAAPTGAVFFTSFAPTNDICSYGGKSYLWAVKYNTGGAVATSLSGIGLLQVSTGAVEEVNFRTDFTEMQGRRTSAMEGVPPTGQGLAIVVPPKAINKILHIKKR